MDEIGFQQSVDEGRRAGDILHTSRPDPVLQRRVEARLVASCKTVVTPVFTVEQLPIQLVLQALISGYYTTEAVPCAIADLQRAWQLAKAIAVVMVACGGGEAEHRCYAEGTAGEILLVKRVAPKQRQVAKAAGVTLDPAHGPHRHSNVQLFIEEVGDHAEYGEP